MDAKNCESCLTRSNHDCATQLRFGPRSAPSLLLFLPSASAFAGIRPQGALAAYASHRWPAICRIVVDPLQTGLQTRVRQWQHRLLVNLATHHAAIAAVIPIYYMYLTAQNAFKSIGLNWRVLDTWTALIISYVAANLPIVIWLMRDYFENISRELEESAAIDGASLLATVLRVVLPLVAPGLVATFLFVLVFA